MTKKKQRAKLARALRAQGIKGVRAFHVARAVIAAGHPSGLSTATVAALGLATIPGHFCPIRFKHKNTQVFCATTGTCVITAWQMFCRA